MFPILNAAYNKTAVMGYGERSLYYRPTNAHPSGLLDFQGTPYDPASNGHRILKSLYGCPNIIVDEVHELTGATYTAAPICSAGWQVKVYSKSSLFERADHIALAAQ